MRLWSHAIPDSALTSVLFAAATAAGAAAGGAALPALCAMAVTFVAGAMVSRFSVKAVVIAGGLLCAAAPFVPRDVGILALGAGSGALALGSSVIAGVLHGDPGHRAATLTALWGWLALGIAARMLAGGNAGDYLAAGLGAAVAVSAAPLWIPVPEAHERRHGYGSLLGLGAVMFLAAAGERAVGMFSGAFLAREVRIEESAARFLVLAYWGSLAAGRFLLSRLMLRISTASVIIMGALAACFGVVLMHTAQSEFSGLPAMMLIGFGAAGIVPGVLSTDGCSRPALAGALLAAAASGGIAMEPVMEHIAAARGLRAAWLLLAAVFAAAGGVGAGLRRWGGVAVVALAALVSAPQMSAAPAPAEFPMAVWYGGGKARAPMLEADPRARKEAWRQDLKQIRALGFNSIRCWIDWASGEPAEGQYRFDTVDVLLELAEQEGLRVVIQVYMDAAPDWVGRKYPDSLYEAAGGEKMHSESAPGFCFDHPGVRKAELSFFEALARRAGASRAFLGWDLWSEPHVINWATANYLYRPEFCFCPSSVQRFRVWLRKKYASLEGLNQAWYRRYISWDEVQPGRLSTILSYTDYIDWRTFIQEKLGEDLHLRYEAVKRGAPDRIATSHAAIPSLFTSPHAGDGAPDDWIMVRQVDAYGTSFYPKHSMPVGRDAGWRAALLDFERSSAYGPSGPGGFWIGELQAGFGTVALNVSANVTADDLRMWTWSALARGAKAINYYAWFPMSTGYESGGFGLIQLDGTITARARAAGEIARVVERNQDLFLKARPPRAEVAIIYNPLAYMVGGRQRAATVTGPQSEVGSIERDSWLGAYRALFPANVPVDFVHVATITPENLRGYKLLLFPYPIMMPERAAGVLREYVREGGRLVSEARLAWNNETGRASEVIPGLGLHEVTGCREASVRSVPDLRTELVWDADTLGLHAGERLPARLYEEELQPSGPGTRVVARFANGAPAAVEADYGKGRALTLGSYVAVAYETQRNAAAERFFGGLLDWAGVARPVRISGGQPEVRWLESGAAKIVFVFNHGEAAMSAAVSFPLQANSTTDLVSRQAVSMSQIEIPAGAVRVLKLE